MQVCEFRGKIRWYTNNLNGKTKDFAISDKKTDKYESKHNTNYIVNEY